MTYVIAILRHRVMHATRNVLDPKLQDIRIVMPIRGSQSIAGEATAGQRISRPAHFMGGLS
ncbi:hypothetical protein ABZ759_13390 [Streptomyces sp. NPDC047860]|uniref:hypothetical protein n=1 Tax=Streptomyces sp. NPDC047860 TaxID=3155743 RepID=UPI0033C0C9E5